MTETKTTQSERAVGRRKTAAARVRLTAGTGVVTVNGKGLKEYFTLRLWQEKVLSPLVLTGREKQLDVSVRVLGGGVSGQADAVRHGIARALVSWNEELKPTLRAAGFMTRDPRAKERKKPGLRKARRGHQWRKR
ncbi:MAG: 30S ribosomal protein S9 [Candidatus Magasanikbacteria bacterium]|nr:30S ribosomal protein S9 [Candidatus Magasanikbacteria bacterium]